MRNVMTISAGTQFVGLGNQVYKVIRPFAELAKYRQD